MGDNKYREFLYENDSIQNSSRFHYNSLNSIWKGEKYNVIMDCDIRYNRFSTCNRRGIYTRFWHI